MSTVRKERKKQLENLLRFATVLAETVNRHKVISDTEIKQLDPQAQQEIFVAVKSLSHCLLTSNKSLVENLSISKQLLKDNTPAFMTNPRTNVKVCMDFIKEFSSLNTINSIRKELRGYADL